MGQVAGNDVYIKATNARGAKIYARRCADNNNIAKLSRIKRLKLDPIQPKTMRKQHVHQFEFRTWDGESLTLGQSSLESWLTISAPRPEQRKRVRVCKSCCRYTHDVWL